MGDACSTVGREEKYMRVVGYEKRKESNHLKVLGVDGRIILKWGLKIRGRCYRLD